MPGEVRFEVDITGHHAPFKWKLFRVEPGKTARFGVMLNCKAVEGTEDVFEDAAFAAQAAEAEAYDVWRHENTKDTLVVLRGEMPSGRDDADEIEVCEPVRPKDSTRPTNPAPTPDPMEFMD